VLLLGFVALGGCSRAEGQAGPSEAEAPTAAASDETATQAGVEAEGDPSAAEEPVPEVAEVAEVAKPPPPPEPSDAGTCPERDDSLYGVLVTPDRPSEGDELQIVAATFDGEGPLALRIETADGEPVEAKLTFRPGVPSATIATIESPTKGKLRVATGRGGEGKACISVHVAGRSGRIRPRKALDDAVWPVERSWDGGEEALFSAWVREMFTAPRGEDLAWDRMDRVTSDASRNLLHDHFGWNEDDADRRVGLYLKPDCADAPYFLRAYYSWKRGLPYGFRQCSRGRDGPPRCGGLRHVMASPADAPDTSKPGELGQIQKYFRRTIAWGVHSGNGRTPFGDDDTDYYPLKLSRKTLRPGATYADPYGHLFVVVELMAPEGETPGILYAIDGQPDGSITRKRFWEGNFLWNPDPALGGAGFKAFRPLDVRTEDGTRTLVAATDAEIAKRPGYGDVSDEQSKLTAPQFYDKMDALITPGKRNALVAQSEAVTALFEAAKVRVTSVNNGEENKAKGGGTVVMPDGYSIFETTGAWENYSTPARDLRLLIAIDLVRGFDDKVARNPDVYLRKGQTMDQLRTELETARKKMLADPSLSFEYTRSDGSKWTLTVADLIERADDLEMAYNPNDCPEIRWAAPKGSEERKTCRDRAPAEQQRKMAAYRPWFAQRRRPARGDPGPPVK
jgi:hypothetical protein